MMQWRRRSVGGIAALINPSQVVAEQVVKHTLAVGKGGAQVSVNGGAV